MTFAEKQAAMAKAMDAKLKTLSRDKVLQADQNRNKHTTEEKASIKAYFLALASGDPEQHAKANALIIKDYEAHDIEWRDEAELKSKAQSVGTSGAGGVLVPTILRQNIIEKLHYISPVRQLATVITDMPAVLDMPYDNALPTTYWVGEGVSITPSGATFAKKQLVPFKLAGLDPFTSESLADTAVSPDLQRLVEDRFTIAIALAENAAFVSGDGASKPFGFRSSDITPAIATGNTTVGNLAFNDILGLEYTLPTAYRALGTYVTSSKGLQLIQGMKDSAGRPIYLPGQAGLNGAFGATFNSRPITIVDEIPTNLGAGTNETELWYSVFSMYWIGNRGAMRTDYGTNGTDFAQDQISLRMIERVAGRPFLDEAWAKMNIK
ncbi:phage major capsid protein [Cryobacterium sp. 10S3]|uniref:phage major capsid protein n=1 Tax=Cryobacterium sp. 10S3 TaxID=3048582 RepID=UPI002AC9E928|nr:phage major capsid protein [Cryobacterium sp. 10S3]MEB0287224.1 phage major capsid protein [Cryobacterium sp. 10S3]WPX14179.1 phage major capsid protein [Cryobacterium sp. 10S3]